MIEVRRGAAPSRSASASVTAAAPGGSAASGSVPLPQPYGKAPRSTLSRGSLSQPPASKPTPSPSASSSASAGPIVASKVQEIPLVVPLTPQGATGSDLLLAGLVASASETTRAARPLTDNPNPVTVAGGVGTTNTPAAKPHEATHAAPPDLTLVGGGSASDATILMSRLRNGLS